jgi:hypothetical protein
VLDAIYHSKAASYERVIILLQCIKITRKMVRLQTEFLTELHSYLKDVLGPAVITLADGWSGLFTTTEESLEALIKKSDLLTFESLEKVVIEDV